MRLLLIILSLYAAKQTQVILTSGKLYLPSTAHEIECQHGDTLEGSMTWKTTLSNKINLDVYLYKEGKNVAEKSFTSFSYETEEFSFPINETGKYIIMPVRRNLNLSETAEYEIELVKAGINYSFSGSFQKEFDTYQINGTNEPGVYEKVNLKISFPSVFFFTLSIDLLDDGKLKYSKFFTITNGNSAYQSNFYFGHLQSSGNISFRLKWKQTLFLNNNLRPYNFTVSYEISEEPAPSENYTLFLKGIHTFPNYFYKIECQEGEILKGIVHWKSKADLNVEFYEEGQKLNEASTLQFESNSTENETMELLVNKTGIHYFKVKQLTIYNRESVPFEIELNCGSNIVHSSGVIYKKFNQTDLVFATQNSLCKFRLTYTKLSNIISQQTDSFYLKVNLQSTSPSASPSTSIFLGPSETSNEETIYYFTAEKTSSYQFIKFVESNSENFEYFEYEYILEHPSNQANCELLLYNPIDPKNDTTPSIPSQNEDQETDSNNEETGKNNNESGEDIEIIDSLEHEPSKKSGEVPKEIIIGICIGLACFLVISVLLFKYHKQIFSRIQPLEEVSREHLHEISSVHSEPDVCSICLELGLTGSLPCGHKFHLSCIMSWLARNYHCPNCRIPARIEDVRHGI